MPVHQISVRLGDEPLALSRLTSLLYREDLHLISMLVSRGADGLFCHIATANAEKVTSLLKSHHIFHQEKPLLVVKIPKHPGGLHTIINILRKNDVVINHLYPAWSSSGQTDLLIIALDDTDRVRQLMEENWIDLID